MTFISEQWQKPALRFALLAICVSLPLFGSLTSLSLAAVFGASCGVGLLTTLIVEVGLYFKTIGDEAKATIIELRETIENIKKSTKTVEDEKTIAHLTETISELGKTAKTLKQNLAFNPKKGEKPLVNQLSATLAGVNKTVENVNKNIMFDTKKGEKPIAKEVSETLDELTKTLNKLGRNLETNSKEGQQPLAQQLTDAVEKINTSVEKINSGMDVAGSVFYPLTRALDGVRSLGRKIGVLSPVKSVVTAKPTPLLENDMHNNVSDQSENTHGVAEPENNKHEESRPRTRSKTKARLVK